MILFLQIMIYAIISPENKQELIRFSVENNQHILMGELVEIRENIFKNSHDGGHQAQLLKQIFLNQELIISNANLFEKNDNQFFTTVRNTLNFIQSFFENDLANFGQEETDVAKLHQCKVNCRSVEEKLSEHYKQVLLSIPATNQGLQSQLTKTFSEVVEQLQQIQGRIEESCQKNSENVYKARRVIAHENYIKDYISEIDGYIKQRSQTYKIKDTIQSLFFNCVGVKTDKQVREEFLNNLKLRLWTYKSEDHLRLKKHIECNKDEFKARFFNKQHSLAALLDRLENGLTEPDKINSHQLKP